ncbi:MAG: T9SS type A sorting domain-containing protein, partial [Bacteroidales bacterium]|nr:T9SS type A sorting domain-containing protein [Bacteroidales bacterium]
TVKYTFTARSEYVIVVNYISGEVSVADAPATLGSFSAYPNPATSSVTFQYTLANRSASDAANIVITNLVGNRVRVIPVSGNSGKKTIDLSNMVAGIYFYSMEINGKPASTKKLIVK